VVVGAGCAGISEGGELSDTLTAKILALREGWAMRFEGRSTVMNRARDYSLRRGCVNKRRYETWRDAKERMPEYFIYRCEHCDGYHHTSVWPTEGKE
jgi:hypothetical protein